MTYELKAGSMTTRVISSVSILRVSTTGKLLMSFTMVLQPFMVSSVKVSQSIGAVVNV